MSRWEAKIDAIDDDARVLRIEHGGASTSWLDLFTGLATPTFAEWFSATLSSMPFDQFRWETPGLTIDTIDTTFECVVLAAPELDRPPDPHAFEQHFGTAEQVVTFGNLRGDATLVVPRPAPGEDAAHLAAFLRTSSSERSHALWAAVATAAMTRLSEVPVWLNTAGAGVPWLHVRLDDRPKYYRYRPYC